MHEFFNSLLRARRSNPVKNVCVNSGLPRICKQILAMTYPIDHFATRHTPRALSIRIAHSSQTALGRREKIFDFRGNPVKLGFTLAEIMVVLGVIGVLTCILLPAAFQATPDENVIKFKKAHNTLYTVIRELVNSDKYYLDGNLSIKANGADVLGGFAVSNGDYTTDEGLITYFCNTIADVLNPKAVNCSTIKTGEAHVPYTYVVIETVTTASYHDTIASVKPKLDTTCADNASKVGEEIVLRDGVVFYQTNPSAAFGVRWCDGSSREGLCWFFNALNSAGEIYHYKPFCIDIDGIGQGEAPFGYAIRVDGRIISGARADEWLEKNIQGDN